MGICLSSDTKNKLAALGVPHQKLSFINFPSPQQGKIQPHKISIGIASRCHANGCKREYLLGQLSPRLEPKAFIFHVMGQGWDAVIHELHRYGSEIVYHGDFDPELYRNLWQQLDYYLYLGNDEGSTGFMDAMEAGVPAIATPQGFHLDLPEGLTYAFNDLEGLAQIFSELSEERRRRKVAVSVLSWSDYARKHLIIWREVLNRRAGKTLYPFTREELVSAGLSVETTEAASTGNSWLTRMPALPGPGGAAHRPRLLIVADEPQNRLEATWRQIIRSAPNDLPIFLNRAGSPVEKRKFPSEQGLEILLLDYRNYSDEEITMLSFDFDIVGFWNFAPLRLLKRLQRRSKANYVLRHNHLLKISARLQGRSALADLSRDLFFKFVNSLRTRSRAITVSFWTCSLHDKNSVPHARGFLREFLAGVDTVFYAETDWEAELKPVARSFCLMPLPEAEASWEQVFNILFRTMRDIPTKERYTIGYITSLFIIKCLGVIVRNLPRRKQSHA
jgi:hypothetical protein